MTDTRTATADPQILPFRAAPVSGSLQGSEILRIAAEIRTLVAAGERVCNLTVGDFDPRQFRIPAVLLEGTIAALRHGETNYPPSPGMTTLREAVCAYYERAFGLRYTPENVLITAGSRPGVYGTYRTLVGEGERVVYGVPSWNNNYYTHMVGGVEVPVACGPDDAFLPGPDALSGALRGARMLALNSPLNPSGTAFTAESLGAIGDLILEENHRRAAEEGALYLLYDQVYWPLTFGDTVHVNPVSLRPEMAPYTVLIDGISKAFAATGMRVGWVLGPAPAIAVMNNVLGHVGTWAPRAEQVATAKLLEMPDEIAAYHAELIAGVQARLNLLFEGIGSLKAAGHPVDAIRPMGAIYMSAQFNLRGRTTASGTQLRTADEVRRWLLAEAGLAVVPFDAFGADATGGWCRLSVGAVSLDDIGEALQRLRAGLETLR
jgi:aspartate aminotransferase